MSGEAMTRRPWWACPNDPRCPHGAVVHDVYDDEVPRCCVEGCLCGARLKAGERLIPLDRMIDDATGLNGKRLAEAEEIVAGIKALKAERDGRRRSKQ